jgi:hypothetical protein
MSILYLLGTDKKTHRWPGKIFMVGYQVLNLALKKMEFFQDVKPTENCVVPEDVVGISYTYMV